MTGNLGYIGSVLSPSLVAQGFDVVGLDVGFYKDCLLDECQDPKKQIFQDVREINVDDLRGFEAVIHLASLSNDPLGELAPNLTQDINFNGTVRLAEAAKKAGVNRFLFVSTQSLYGKSNTESEVTEDDSRKNPLTTYALTKWNAEIALNKLVDNQFHVVSFRPSTVFGWSPRLRCDIVFNNLVACAFTTGRIEIKSDGTPWRPVIHIQDVCSALIAGLKAPLDLISGRAYNVGVKDGNYTVKQLAESAQRTVPGSDLIFTNEHTDPRSYKVSFNRIQAELGDYFSSNWDLDSGGSELVTRFEKIGFTQHQFRGKATNRLAQVHALRNAGLLNDELRFPC